MFGSSSGGGGGNRGESAMLAKPLLPSALRASGRTTVLSSSAHPPGGGAPRREGRTAGTGKPAAGTTVGGPGAPQTARAGLAGGSGGRSRNTGGGAVDGADEDLLKLPWAYGSRSSTGGPEQRSPGSDASASSARGASGGRKGTRARGVGTAETKKKAGEGALGKAARPPKEAHPAGYTNGSVVVPAESKVFSQMPQRCPVRSDGSRTAQGTKALADVEVRSESLRSLALGCMHAPSGRSWNPSMYGSMRAYISIHRRVCSMPCFI